MEITDQSALDYFGKELIKFARDWPIKDITQQISKIFYRPRVSKISHKETLIKIRQLYKKLPREEKNIILEIIPRIMDKTIENFLFMVEHDKQLIITIETPKGKQSIKPLSNDLYGKSGWIARFGKR